MPSTAAPFGLRPVYHPSGTIRNEAGTILTGYATGILQYRPVFIGTDGSLQAATAGIRFCGTFLGVEYTDTNGRRQYVNQWTASTTATDIVAYYTRDQNIVYEIQSVGSVALADVGNQADFSAASAGSTTTGLSTCSLSGTMTSTGSAGLRILGFGREVDNAAGDAFTNVLVQISEHQDVADQVAYGG